MNIRREEKNITVLGFLVRNVVHLGVVVVKGLEINLGYDGGLYVCVCVGGVMGEEGGRDNQFPPPLLPHPQVWRDFDQTSQHILT